MKTKASFPPTEEVSAGKAHPLEQALKCGRSWFVLAETSPRSFAYSGLRRHILNAIFIVSLSLTSYFVWDFDRANCGLPATVLFRNAPPTAGEESVQGTEEKAAEGQRVKMPHWSCLSTLLETRSLLTWGRQKTTGDHLQPSDKWLSSGNKLHTDRDWDGQERGQTSAGGN